MQIEGAGRAIEELSTLLRRELASMAAYEEALEELGEAETAETVRELAREHARNARTLRTEIARLGGVPSGGAAALVFFGATRSEDSARPDEEEILRALVSCEERALRSSEAAAERLPLACRDLVQAVLVPARRRNMGVLRRLLALTGAPTAHADCPSLASADGSRTSPNTTEVAI